MTDIVDKIERIFAEEQAPRPPLKCQHCDRDWHPEPLTRRVANMWLNHNFDANYDPADDDTPIVCVGANYHGPNRAMWGSVGGPVKPMAAVTSFLEKMQRMCTSPRAARQS